MSVEVQPNEPAWYCVKSKPKHEHIAAANVRRNLGLEVFHPQLRVERVTRRGPVRLTESLFPGYLFVQCAMAERLGDVRHAYGVGSVVRFGDRIPSIADAVIRELRSCFPGDEPVAAADPLSPGAEVTIRHGAFAGMRASVLRVLPARERVQVLFDFLGRPTTAEVDRGAVALEHNSLAILAPFLAAPQRGMMRI